MSDRNGGSRALRLVLAASLMAMLSGCKDAANWFVLMSTESVNGKPYLMVVTAATPSVQEHANSRFHIYLATQPDGSAWKPVVTITDNDQAG